MNPAKTTIAYIAHKFNFDIDYFIKGGVWLSLNQIFTVLFGLLTTALLAHYLTATDYGIYRYLIGLTALLSAFSLTGLPQAILQTAAKGFDGFYYETVKQNLLYSLGIFFAAGVAAGYYYTKDNNILALGCLLIALVQPIITIFQNIPPYLQGQKLFKRSAQVQLFRLAVVTVATLVTITFTQSALALFAVFLLSNAIVNLMTNLVVSINGKKTPRTIYDRYLAFAKHTSVRNSIALVSNRLDTILLFVFIGSAELATYIISIIAPEQIKSFIKNLFTLLIPKYATYDKDTLKKTVKKRSLQLLPLLLLITVMYIIAAPFLYNLLFPKYADAVIYSQLAALSIPSLLLLLPYNALQTELNEKSLYTLIFSTSVLQILLLLYLTFYFGILGAIVARIIYRYVLGLLTYLLFYFGKQI